MALYLIGLGLADQKDISVKGLEAVRSCDMIYLENYTSILQCSIKDLEQFYGKQIILAEREIIEANGHKILELAKIKKVALLVIGDPFSATTHAGLFKEAWQQKIEIKIIHNASIITAVGVTGLQLYKFGRITSIPFDTPQLETPYLVLKENLSLGMHSLFLLDLQPPKNRFMTINQALDILEKIEHKRQEKLVTSETLAVGCARLGAENQLIKVGTVNQLKMFDFGPAPHCLIIPGKLHFMEQEVLELYY